MDTVAEADDDRWRRDHPVVQKKNRGDHMSRIEKILYVRIMHGLGLSEAVKYLGSICNDYAGPWTERGCLVAKLSDDRREELERLREALIVDAERTRRVLRENASDGMLGIPPPLNELVSMLSSLNADIATIKILLR